MNKKRNMMLFDGDLYDFVYLLLDEFITDDAAPVISPRSAEPGPGVLDFVDVAGKFSITGGYLMAAVGSTNPSTEGFTSSIAYPRSAGLALKVTDIFGLHGTQSQGFIGFHTGTPATNTTFAYTVGSPHTIDAIQTAWIGGSSGRIRLHAAPEELTHIIILRASGAFIIENNKLVCVIDASNLSPLYIGGCTRLGGLAYSLNYLRLGQLGGVWKDTYGPGSLVVSGAIGLGQTFITEQNALFYFTVTNRGTAGSSTVKFRIQDANNYWILTIGSNGSVDLSEVVAGISISRGTSVAGSIVNGNRVGMSLRGQNVLFWFPGGLKIEYTAGLNFMTETACEFSGLATNAVLSDLEVYPGDLSGITEGWLNAL